MDYELLIQRVMEEVRKRLAEEEAKKAVCGKKEECTTAEEVKRVALNKKFIMEKDVRAAKEQGAVPLKFRELLRSRIWQKSMPMSMDFF